MTAWTLGMAPTVCASNAALPVLDAKGGAAVSIVTNGDVMNINSTAAKNLIKWVDFSIASGKTVDFHDKDYLNYVTGSAISDIYGTLKGTGDIYLVNPNGILIHDGAAVNVGNLHLSTKDLTDNLPTSYSNGLTKLANASIGSGDVINMGTLNATNISVDGNTIKFKNVADVQDKNGSADNVTVDLQAGSAPIHVGYSETNYSNPTPPALTNWNAHDKTIYKYMLVSSASDLARIGNNPNNYSDRQRYMLETDITVSGHTPIGYKDKVLAKDQSFSAVFDGLGHTITLQNPQSAKIHDNLTGVGVFGYVSGTTIRNLGVRTEGFSTDANYVGAVAAYLDRSLLENVWHEGDITVNVSGGKDCLAGGIVGYNRGGTIKTAYNTGDITAVNASEDSKLVSGDRLCLGGIAGFNEGTISTAYNTGTISSKDVVIDGAISINNGGIVGANYSTQDNTATIQDVYNTGDISSLKYAGGIAGYAFKNNDAEKSPIIQRAYQGTGSITSEEGSARAIENGAGTLEDCYYLDGAPNDSNPNAKKKSAANMNKQSTFKNWDFNNTWRIYEEQTMPLLTAFMTRADNITSQTPYDGSKNAGATYATPTTPESFNSTNAQTGYNYIQNVSIITPKELTVTGSIDKTYDGTDTATLTAGNLSGVVAGDELTVSTTSAAYDAGKNVGTDKAVTYSGLTLGGTKAKNYNIAFSGTGKGNITSKQLTATFADVSKTYDGTKDVTAGAGSLTGVLSGETVTVSGTAAFEDKNVGTNKKVNYSSVTLGGTDAGNYTIANTATGKGTITAKQLTATFADVSKTYDGGLTVDAGAGSLTGVVSGDTVTVSGTAKFADKNVGTNKQVNYTGVALGGTDAGNYSIAATVTGTGTISQAPITVSVADITKTYDGTTKTDNTTDAAGGALKVTSGKLYDGDTMSGGTKTYTDVNAGKGNKTVTVTGVTISDGNNGGNYNVTYADNTTSTINQRPLTVEFKTVSKIYDGKTTVELPTTTQYYTLNGKLDSDVIDLATDKLSAEFADKNAGENKTVYYKGVALTGVPAGNYALKSTTATGLGSIHKAGVHITAFADTTKVYDGTTDAPLGAATFDGLIDADEGKVGVKGTAVYDGKDVGDHTVSYSGLALTGAEARNYQLDTFSLAGFGTISRRPLWLVATPQTITEGEATPTTWSGNLTGFVAGEGLGANDFYFFALDNPAATAAGSYSVTGTLSIDGDEAKTSGDYGDNYTFANAAANATAFTINAYVPPAPEPSPTPTPQPTPSPKPQDIVEKVTGNPGAAKEYTDVIASQESGANTVLPTANLLPTESTTPTNSVLPTGNNQPTGSAQQTEKAQENNSVSGEQNETQEQNGLLPAQPTTGGQPAAGRQETQLGVTYTDINMPKSMSVEALAAALNGEKTATLPNNAGVETVNATSAGAEAQPTGTQGAPQQGDEEEA